MNRVVDLRLRKLQKRLVLPLGGYTHEQLRAMPDAELMRAVDAELAGGADDAMFREAGEVDLATTELTHVRS